MREQVLKAEAEHKVQLCWAATPREVAAVRSKAVCSGVIGRRREYGFLREEDREQFVYGRTDATFTVSRDVRDALNLGPVAGGGTTLGPWTTMWPPLHGGGKGKPVTMPAAPAAVPPKPVKAPAAPKPAAVKAETPAPPKAPAAKPVPAKPAPEAASPPSKPAPKPPEAEPRRNRFRKSEIATS